MVTPENFESLLSNLPKDFDFLNVDIDGNDIHLIESLKNFKPNVICVEVNGRDERFKRKTDSNWKKIKSVR